MKHLLAIAASFIMFAVLPVSSMAYQGPSPVDNVKLLHHDSVTISLGGKTIYIDPWKLTHTAKADIVLITHGHGDHFDPESVLGVKKDKATVIAPETVVSKVTWKDIKKAAPGDSFEIGNITIKAVASYNIKKPFHPKGDKNVGYVISYKGEKYYHAGDTDNNPEMKDLKGITVALVPVSGMYVMNAKDAAAAVNSFKPAYTVPMHYGEIVGKLKDAEKFSELVSPATRVIILEPTEPLKNRK